ncbi:exopolyphosphatase [Amanita muscaria]
MAVPLTLFLASSKQSYLRDILANRGKEWTVVMGNEAGDLDTLASSIAYAYYLSTYKKTQSVALVQMDRIDIRLRAENLYALSLAGITDPASQLLFLSDLSPSASNPTTFPSNKFALVDHNKLDPRYESPSAVVTAIIDHHADEAQHLSADPRIIQEAGSCSSLIADYFFPSTSSTTTTTRQDENETKFEIPTELATLLTCAMLIDTNGLKPKGKAQAVDHIAAYNLLPRSSLAPEVDALLPPSLTGGDLTIEQQEQVHDIPALQQLTSTLSTKKTDLSHLSTYDIIRRDFKEYAYEIPSSSVSATEGEKINIKAGLSTVPLPLEGDWAADGKLLNSALDWMDRRDLSILGILTTFRALKHGDKKGKHEREQVWIVRSKSPQSPTFLANLANKLFAGLEASEDLQLKEHNKFKVDVGDREDVRVKVYKQKNGDVTRKGVAPLLAKILVG